MNKATRIYRTDTHPWIELRTAKGFRIHRKAWGGPKTVEKEKKNLVRFILTTIRNEYWDEPLAQKIYDEIKGSDDPFNKVYYLADIRLPEVDEAWAIEVDEAHRSVAEQLDEINAELAERARAYRESIKDLLKRRERFNAIYFELDAKLENFVQRGFRKGA